MSLYKVVGPPRQCDSWSSVHALQKEDCAVVQSAEYLPVYLVSFGLQGSWSSIMSTWQGLDGLEFEFCYW